MKEPTSPYTNVVASFNSTALLPSLGMGKLFTNNQYVTIAIPLSVLVAIGVWIVLGKTKFGYELRATGCNKDAARYCGMPPIRSSSPVIASSVRPRPVTRRMPPGVFTSTCWSL